MSDTTEQQQERNDRAIIADKLTWVMSKIEEVPRNGRNDFHNYDYATKADIMGAVRGPMAEAGLAVIPSIAWHETEQLEKIGKGGEVTGTETQVIVGLEVTLIEKDSGATWKSLWIGEGRDNGDKAFYKAYSGALKYWALDTFLLKEGDDPERDTTTDQGQRRRRRNGHQNKGSHDPQPPGGKEYEPKGLDDKMGFGKHEGKTVRWICENERGYLRWLLTESDMDFSVKQSVIDYAAEQKQKEAKTPANEPAEPPQDEFEFDEDDELPFK